MPALATDSASLSASAHSDAARAAYPLPVPESLIARYDGYAPRYTSYPTAAEFRADFDAAQLDAAIAARNLLPGAPDLSLYLHLPFCREACWYCACHRAITRRPERAERYLQALRQEIVQRGDQLAGHRRVRQLHLGGGTPTFYRMEELAGLREHIAHHFHIAERAEREWSIEIDPRTVAPDQAKALVAMGFDRVSMGIQDFDPTVQQAIHRQQDIRMVRALVESVRAAGVRGISFDLIYGLPWQTVAGFRRTLRVVKQLRPDRVSVYGYAHMPDRFRLQSLIPDAALPDAATRLQLMAACHHELGEAGYVHVGMDHFALAHDPLVQAQRDGSLQRNFQGYSTLGGCDLIGMGASAISQVSGVYGQNASAIAEWEQRVGQGGSAVARGYAMTADDHLRSDIIQSLMCHGRVDLVAIERRHGIDFAQYFASLQPTLARMADDGLLHVGRRVLALTECGRFLMRSVAVLFDAHRGAESATRFSRAI